METVWVQFNSFALSTPHLLHMGLKHCRIFHNNYSPVLFQLQQVEHLQRSSNIMGVHSSVLADTANAQFWRIGIVEVFQNGALPIAMVADAPQI